MCVSVGPVDALIFAGGTGQRMTGSPRPKQFLELAGKPIIAYTLDRFAFHPEVTSIAVACLPAWIDYLNEIVDRQKYPVFLLSRVVCVGRSRYGRGSAIFAVGTLVTRALLFWFTTACVRLSIRIRSVTASALLGRGEQQRLRPPQPKQSFLLGTMVEPNSSWIARAAFLRALLNPFVLRSFIGLTFEPRMRVDLISLTR